MLHGVCLTPDTAHPCPTAPSLPACAWRIAQRPTSVRWGSGNGGFAATSLFISEGGSLGDAKESKYRILEWKFARDAIGAMD